MIEKFFVPIEPVYTAEIIGLQQPGKGLFRFESHDARYYFRFPKAGVEIPYLGATGATKRLLGHEDGLLRYYAKNGEMAYLMTKIAAAYGTLMHIEIGNFERNGRRVNFDEVEERGYRAAIENGFPFAASEWAFFLPRNLASWIHFCNEHEVKVLAIEFPVWSDEFSVATLCDIYCELRFGRRREPVRAIINLKKGYQDDGRADKDKIFYNDSDLQMQIERLIWRECVPHLPVDMIFNWAPNNWTGTTPTYTLKNWTDGTRFNDETLRHMLELLKRIPGHFSPPSKVAILSGSYGPGDDLQKNISLQRIKRPKKNSF